MDFNLSSILNVVAMCGIPIASHMLCTCLRLCFLSGPKIATTPLSISPHTGKINLNN